MNNTDFFRLQVSGIAREREDEFTRLAFDAGAAGVSEEMPFSQPDLVYEPDVVETPEMHVSVYFTEAPSESSLLRLQAPFPEASWTMLREENRDWLAEWKKGFKPFRFAGDFWIVPRWLEIPPEAPKDLNKILFVEPGMAFGTGTHETTRLAAAFVIEAMTSVTESVLDVGTGTGVLALVAKRLGATDVVGLDNDPEARRTARENLALNNDQAISIPDTQIEEIDRQFDVVIANIIDGVLTLLQHQLVRVMKPNGKLILSGILHEREEAFFADFTKNTGLRLLHRRHEGDWSAGVLAR